MRARLFGCALAPISAALALFGGFVTLAACERDDADSSQPGDKPAAASATPVAPAPAASALPYDTPRLLFLPDAGDLAPPEAPFEELMPKAPVLGRCPTDMVEINHRFCIDRYESSLRDTAQQRTISPYYHPEHAQLAATRRRCVPGSTYGPARRRARARRR